MIRKHKYSISIYTEEIFERRCQEEIIRSDEDNSSFVYLEFDFESLKKERQEAVEGNHRDNVWISVFRRYENISELDRRVVVELIDSIEVFEGNRIQVNFKYKDECRRAIEYIEGRVSPSKRMFL